MSPHLRITIHLIGYFGLSLRRYNGHLSHLREESEGVVRETYLGGVPNVHDGKQFLLYLHLALSETPVYIPKSSRDHGR